MMRIRSLMPAISIVLLAMLLLSACSAGQPESPATTPEASVVETGSNE